MSNQLTKRAIAQSFVKLLNQRPMDKITVKDIVEDCGINRNTFYYHYQDIYALVEELLNTETERVLSEYRDDFNWVDGFIESTRFARENKKAVYHIYNSVRREEVERYIFRVSENVMIKAVHNQAKELNVAEEDMHYIAMFYMHAIDGLLLDWLQRGMVDDPEEVIRKLGDIFDGNLQYTLEKCSKK